MTIDFKIMISLFYLLVLILKPLMEENTSEL